MQHPVSRSNGLALVATQVIDDDKVAWFEGRDEKLLNLAQEALRADKTIQESASNHKVHSKRVSRSSVSGSSSTTQSGSIHPLTAKHRSRLTGTIGPWI